MSCYITVGSLALPHICYATHEKSAPICCRLQDDQEDGNDDDDDDDDGGDDGADDGYYDVVDEDDDEDDDEDVHDDVADEAKVSVLRVLSSPFKMIEK